MIQLSRLNGNHFVLNCELIKAIEATPDTVITLSTGEKIMVRESVDDVVKKTMDYRKRLYQEPPSGG
jgi:flagellar protein FlbD